MAYVEAVDNKVFLYTQKQVYETRQKLYELEELLREKHFLRVSKSLLLNLMKVQSIRPAMNGRMMAVLRGGEEWRQPRMVAVLLISVLATLIAWIGDVQSAKVLSRELEEFQRINSQA